MISSLPALLRRILTTNSAFLPGVLVLGLLLPIPVSAEDYSKDVEADVEELRARILTTSRLPHGESVASLAELPVILWVERCFIGSNDVYSGEGFRYAVLRVSVGNRTDEEIVIPRDQITLKTDSRSYPVGPGTSRRFRNSPLEIDWTPEQHPRAQTQLDTPKTITVRPGKATTIWTVFFGLDSLPVIPSLTLQVQPEGKEILELDVSRQQNARLGLITERTGPEKCLAVMRIHGHLNRVNSAELARQITEIRNQGGERFLVKWESGSTPCDEVLFSWLATTTRFRRDENPLLMQLPVLPELRQIALCQVPEENREALEWDEAGRHLHADELEGTTALLKDIYQRISVDALLREIRTGHLWGRRAALQIGGRRLGSDAFPVLMELADSEDLDLRRDAILALGYQSQANSFLTELLLGNKPEDAELALEALTTVTTRENREQLLKELEGSRIQVPRQIVLPILATHYHPDWDRYLIRCVAEMLPDVRRTALEVLQQLGHPELDGLCIAALNDPDLSVRGVAFQVLKESPDTASRRSALAHVMRQLSAHQQISNSGLALIEEMKETAAAPLLIAQLQNSNIPRYRLIEAIGRVGSDDHCRQVLALLETLNDDEQLAALELAAHLPLETQLKTAKQVAAGKSQPLREAAIGIYRRVANDQAVQGLGEMLNNSSDDMASEVVYALSEIGTESAVGELRRFRNQARDAKNTRNMQIADSGLREWRHRLPGWNFVENGNVHVMGNELDEAITAYTLAITINPDLSEAYSMRGNTYLRRENIDAAGKDFRKALELDPDDSQAVTGVGIVQAIHGEWKEAVQFVRDRADHFPNDRFFPYNMACVYGRAIEAIQKEGEDSENQQQIPELRKEAIALLKGSIALGFNQFDWMKVDPDLATFRDLPEFKELLRQEE